MYEIRECKQRTARENHICDFCGKQIKKGSEYMVCKGQDDNGWFTEKWHIHCDAIQNHYTNTHHHPDGFCSACVAYMHMYEQVCMKCPTRAGCETFDFKEIFSCERAVAAFLPEGPIRNAALQSIKATKERPHYHD